MRNRRNNGKEEIEQFIYGKRKITQKFFFKPKKRIWKNIIYENDQQDVTV
jgi:hypothetical protein